MKKKRDETALTPREQELLELTGKGLSNKEIARIVGISHNTVKTHLHNVYVKLEKGTRIKAFHAHQARPRLGAGNQLEMF